ncbi:MAG TPA: rhodanese-like domain-containing protein [Tessaracoccus flavescens]|uniref:Rhodanese-like domain-containing protein n=1 Tax=Tessaracoccus flavescens TaxID=399497 RepID=A0A921EP61_9ACTN|nr:rhodanese-like domain-containing protein [Tessaracoccus flavescens]
MTTLNRRSLLSLLAVGGLAVAGCSDDSPAGASRDLDAEQFKARAEEASAVLLDVRTPEEFAAGHIPGAININVEGDFASGIASLDKSAPYAVYCRSGNRSAAAMKLMDEAGFEETFHLVGGIGAWERAGFDVESQG